MDCSPVFWVVSLLAYIMGDRCWPRMEQFGLRSFRSNSSAHDVRGTACVTVAPVALAENCTTADVSFLQIRVLRLEMAELERSLHATRVSMPDVEGIDTEVAALKADLYKARHASEVLSDKLEDPSANAARARLLGGKIPEKDELVAKLQVSCMLYVDVFDVWCIAGLQLTVRAADKRMTSNGALANLALASIQS